MRRRALSQIVRGDNSYEEWTYDQWRQQPQTITLGTSATDFSYLSLSFSYCPGVAPPAPFAPLPSYTNNNGNLMQQTVNPLGATQTYQYTDGFNRLNSVSEANSSGTWSRTYTYDNYGNGWLSAYTTTSISPSVSALTPTLDAFNTNPSSGPVNRLVGSNYKYDSNGNQTLVSPFTVGYDAENRQVSVTSQLNGSATYAYDGDGKRVLKTVNGGSATVYVYDAGGDLAAEYNLTPMPCGTCFLTVDHLGSTRLISGGASASRHDYLPFGEDLLTSSRTTALGL